MKPLFSPSLMCADFLELKKQITILNERADFYHIDVMDGHYVKNFCMFPDMIKQIKQVATIPLDIHLMIENPADYLETFAKIGADYISPHAETINKDAFRTMRTIQALGCKTGVVINPSTPLEYIRHYMSYLDKITILTVDAGFAGQKLIPEMLEKIREAKRIREKNNYHYLIEIDGSCNANSFRMLTEAGADVFIVGTSGLFNLDENLEKAWDKMMDFYYEATKGLNLD